jgi:hypothetical protein
VRLRCGPVAHLGHFRWHVHNVLASAVLHVILQLHLTWHGHGGERGGVYRSPTFLELRSQLRLAEWQDSALNAFKELALSRQVKVLKDMVNSMRSASLGGPMPSAPNVAKVASDVSSRPASCKTPLAVDAARYLDSMRVQYIYALDRYARAWCCSPCRLH